MLKTILSGFLFFISGQSYWFFLKLLYIDNMINRKKIISTKTTDSGRWDIIDNREAVLMTVALSLISDAGVSVFNKKISSNSKILYPEKKYSVVDKYNLLGMWRFNIK